MKITRLDDAKPYEAKLHTQMTALRLQGLEASDVESFSCSLSYFLPGGGADWSASPNEKVYVVLDGELTIVTEEKGQKVEHVLKPLDSCFIEFNEFRAAENRTTRMCTMLVVVSSPK